MDYSQDDIIALHKQYALSPATFDLVFTHCQIVCDIALQLLAQRPQAIDVDLVKTGCLLHDIGVYPLFDAHNQLRKDRNYVSHGIEGEKILKKNGFPQTIQRIASHHTGVGLTKQDIIDQKLPLPSQDYVAETPEERLVMYADKFHSKTTPPYFNSFDWYVADVARFGQDKVAAFLKLADEFGKPDLAALSQKYGHTIR